MIGGPRGLTGPSFRSFIVLSSSELDRCRRIIEAADWIDGRATAGTQSEQVNNNLQLEETSEAATLAPSSSVHRVESASRGARIACFFWVESMVRDDAQRRVLLDIDLAIHDLRRARGDGEAVVRLTGCYHNLIRMWPQP